MLTTKKIKSVLLILGSGALIGLGLHYFVFAAKSESIEVANAVVVGRPQTMLSPQSGTVSESLLKPYSFVKRGELAFMINRTEYESRYQAALAALRRALIGRADACSRLMIVDSNMQAAKVQLKTEEAALARAVQLQQNGFLSPQGVDNAARKEQENRFKVNELQLQWRLAYDEATRPLLYNDQVAGAVAELRSVLASREKHFLTVPEDAFVHGIPAAGGDQVANDGVLARLVSRKHFEVEAYVLESQIAQLKPLMRANVKVDTMPGQVFTGYLVSVVPAVAATFAPVVRPNFDSNWVKVSQRVPVLVRVTGTRGPGAWPPVGASASVDFQLSASTAPAHPPAASAEPALAQEAAAAVPAHREGTDITRITRSIANETLSSMSTGRAGRSVCQQRLESQLERWSVQ